MVKLARGLADGLLVVVGLVVLAVLAPIAVLVAKLSGGQSLARAGCLGRSRLLRG